MVPNRVIDQPLYSQAVIKRHATSVIELGHTGPDRYMVRNRYMVEHSTKVHAFYDFRGRGGTYNTIEYSRQTLKPFSVTPLVEYDSQKFIDMPVSEFENWVKQMMRFNVNLGSIKGIIISVIKNNYHSNVGGFCDSLGYNDCNTLEKLWTR